MGNEKHRNYLRNLKEREREENIELERQTIQRNSQLRSQNHHVSEVDQEKIAVAEEEPMSIKMRRLIKMSNRLIDQGISTRKKVIQTILRSSLRDMSKGLSRLCLMMQLQCRKL